jgi:phytoene dehydrogenase-like protein
MTFRYDVVVAEGGHNSLITAAYLATAGYKVGVVEAMQEVGGNCVTDELLPGYFFDTCAAAHSQIQSNPLISRDELGLRESGLEYILLELKVISVFKGSRAAMDTSNVDTVFVAGRAAKRGGRMIEVNLHRLQQAVYDARDRVFAKAGVEVRACDPPMPHRPAAAPPPPNRAATLDPGATIR